MFGVPVVVALAAYIAHVRTWANRLSHVPRHLYDPGAESPLAFVVRNTEKPGLLFLPHFGNRTSGGDPGDPALRRADVADGAASGPGAPRSGAGPLLLSMILVNIAAAFGKRYPYGGELRHEVYLFRSWSCACSPASNACGAPCRRDGRPGASGPQRSGSPSRLASRSVFRG